MKKFLAFASLALVCTAIAFASGTKESGADTSLQDVQKAGQLVMGLDDSFPPMGYRNDDNEIVGYDVDLAKEVCSRLGVELVLQPIDWNAKEQELNTRKIDCIWNGFTITEERAAVINFTEPYLKNAQVLVVKEAAPYKSLSDLAGKTIALQAGSSAADALNDAEAFKASIDSVVEFKDNMTALMDLEIGGSDAVLMDLMVANYNINHSGKAYRILEESLASEDYGVGFRKNDNALRNAVQQTLEEMARDGTLAKITIEWFEADISTVKK